MSRRTTPPVVAGLAGSLLLTGLVAAPAQAAPRPDLAAAVGLAGTTVAPGATASVSVTTANKGKARAGKSLTRLHLSPDPSWSKTDPVVGTVKTKALAPRKKLKAATTVTVPAGTAPGTWYVVACADAARKVKEAKEGNNCRASAALTVTVPATPPAPTPSPAPQPPAPPLPPTPPPPPPPPPGDPQFPMTPDPITVDSTLQTDRAVSQFVYPHTTTVMTATAADGTTYELSLPPNALLGPTTITMTPVASVPGLPLSGGLVAGVQLEPHGLQLYDAATLVITSPDAGSLAQQSAFLFHEDGEDFHLYPPDAPEAGDTKDTMRLSLTHFSTPGVGLGSSADVAGVNAHPPVRTQAQVEAAISGLLAAERESQQQGNPPGESTMQQVVKILGDYYDQSLRPRLVEAENRTEISEAEAAVLISEAISLARQLSLMGAEDDPRVADIMERVERIARAVMLSAWNDCLDHDLSSIEVLLRSARLSALFGYAWQAEAMDKLERCATFEVRFDHTFDSEGSYTGTLQSAEHDDHFRMQATVPVPFLASDARGPLTHAEFSSYYRNTIHDADPDCTSTRVGTTTTSGQLRALVIPMLDVNVLESDLATGPPQPKVQVSVMQPGVNPPRQTYEHTGCDGSTYTYTDNRWHLPDGAGDPFELQAELGNDLVGVEESSDTITSQNDVTTWSQAVEVWHKPEQ